MTKEYGDYLAHHGVKGQKWGVRRYQNTDGSLTEEGKKKYYADANEAISKNKRALAVLKDYERMAETGSLKSKYQEVNDIIKAERGRGYTDAQLRASLNVTISNMDALRNANEKSIEYEQKMKDFVKSNERVTLKDIQKYNKRVAKEMDGNKSFMKKYQKERWKKVTKED